MADYETYKLGDWALQRGGVLKDAFLAFKTFGDRSKPAVIYPTWYSGTISTNVWLVGPDKTLNPDKYFIIIPALFGNGESTSPSNTPPAQTARPFPTITFFDNVRAQHKLVTEHLGVQHARAVLGWSMGAAQTFQWATQFPTFMDLAVPFCGSARTSLHNSVFLEGVKAALLAARAGSSAGVCEPSAADSAAPARPFHGTTGAAQAGSYRPWTDDEKRVGLKALGRVYAGWGFSQAFYREKLYETAPKFGFRDLEHFMVDFWEAWALSKDPENMLVMLSTWQNGDVSQQHPYGGDFKAAMQAIQAKTLVLPCRTDLYFPPEDSELEVASMRPGVGKLDVFPSIYGHWAGGPGDSLEDVAWLDARLRELFDT